MKVYLFRHGETPGNREKRYVGSTEESLTKEGRQALAARLAPKVDWVYVSPRRRCAETADILFPKVGRTVVPGFAECDFGAFEYRNYRELSGDPDYQRWIDSGGVIGFPGGESRAAFQERCVQAFLEVQESAAKRRAQAIALVIHGGTIMALLSRMGVPKRDYFDWQVENGTCIEAMLEGGRLLVLR